MCYIDKGGDLMLKRTTAILIILCMLLSFTACSKKPDDEAFLLQDEQQPADNTDKPLSVTPQTENESEQIIPQEENKQQQQPPQNDNVESPPVIDNSYNEDDEPIEGAVVQGGFIPDFSLGLFPEYSDDFVPSAEEGYAKLMESKFIKTSENDSSTFGSYVDTGAYAFMRKQLYANSFIGEAREEEMVNYFSYDYKAPEGNDAFSVTTEVFDSPWSKNKLVKIGLATAKPEYIKEKPSNLVFLIEISPRMMWNEGKYPMFFRAVSKLMENLGENDKISVVTYLGTEKITIEGKGAENKLEIASAIEDPTAYGTDGAKGIETAYELAKKYYIEGGDNRVVLITSGNLNKISDKDDLTGIIKKNNKDGIHLSVMGFETDVGNGESKLKNYAKIGGGSYSCVKSNFETERAVMELIGGTLKSVAKDVDIKVTFNKETVSEHRLIAYENKVIGSQKTSSYYEDSGEIGEGHTVTMLYEIKQTGSQNQKWLDVNISYKKTDSGEDVFKTYTAEADCYTRMPSEDSVFATAVVQFAMLIARSKYVSGKYSDIVSRIERLNCVKNDVFKNEFLGFVKKYAT